MGQWGVEIARLAGDLVNEFLVGVVIDGAHQGQTVDRHDEDDAHVLGKGEQEFVEVLILDGCLLLVQGRHMQQAVDDAGDVGPEQGLDAVHVKVVAAAQVVDQRGDDHRAVGGDAVAQGKRGVEVTHHGVEPILVALEDACLDDAALNEPVHSVDVLGRQLPFEPVVQALDKAEHLLPLLWCEVFLHCLH